MDKRITILEKSKRIALTALPGVFLQRGVLKYLRQNNSSPHVILIATSRPSISHLIKYRRSMGVFGAYRYYMMARIPGLSWGESFREIKEILSGTDIEPIGIIAATSKKWDLKVLAENITYRPLYAPILHIGHGNGFKSLDGGITKYPFVGKLFADKMLEQRLSVIETIEKDLPIYRNRFVWTGHKDAQQVQHAQELREEIREQFGIAANQKALLVWGSFRQESLFHALGRPLLDYLEKLPKDEFKVILSIHPQEYQKYDDGVEPLGPLIDTYADKEGFIVRNPKEDYVNYIVACDAMICDHSSALDVALLAKRPLALLEIKENIWSKSDYTKLLTRVPVIRNVDDVDAAIKEIFSDRYDYHVGISRRFSNALNPPEAGYEGAVQNATKQLIDQGYTDVSIWR